MTTTAKKSTTAKKAARQPRRAAEAKKALRIRPELIPVSSTYSVLYDKEYVMIPVTDFDAWYEAFEDAAIVDYMGEDLPKGGAREPLLRTRKKHTPDSTLRVTVGKARFIAVPVVDVQEWFEDIEDLAVCRYCEENPQPTIPAEEVWAELNKKAGKPTK